MKKGRGRQGKEHTWNPTITVAMKKNSGSTKKRVVAEGAMKEKGHKEGKNGRTESDIGKDKKIEGQNPILTKHSKPRNQPKGTPKLRVPEPGRPNSREKTRKRKRQQNSQSEMKLQHHEQRQNPKAPPARRKKSKPQREEHPGDIDKEEKAGNSQQRPAQKTHGGRVQDYQTQADTDWFHRATPQGS